MVQGERARHVLVLCGELPGLLVAAHRSKRRHRGLPHLHVMIGIADLGDEVEAALAQVHASL